MRTHNENTGGLDGLPRLNSTGFSPRLLPYGRLDPSILFDCHFSTEFDHHGLHGTSIIAHRTIGILIHRIGLCSLYSSRHSAAARCTSEVSFFLDIRIFSQNPNPCGVHGKSYGCRVVGSWDSHGTSRLPEVSVVRSSAVCTDSEVEVNSFHPSRVGL